MRPVGFPQHVQQQLDGLHGEFTRAQLLQQHLVGLPAQLRQQHALPHDVTPPMTAQVLVQGARVMAVRGGSGLLAELRRQSDEVLLQELRTGEL
ncbi:hypothetical protein, partial [Streptomyces sp. uw30]|uniref:hypothetical protein n=1 Tax=Streptomyces sp. uw30 TaxID=1828179 RepID=UPI0011CDFCA1